MNIFLMEIPLILETFNYRNVTKLCNFCGCLAVWSQVRILGSPVTEYNVSLVLALNKQTYGPKQLAPGLCWETTRPKHSQQEGQPTHCSPRTH